MRLKSLAVVSLLALVPVPMAPAAVRSVLDRPNIVYILADDLGYGDVRCFNAQGKIATPHLDRLAAAGVRFTDAHSGSAVCTPTRYGILTGRYSWRSTLKSGVLNGYSNRLIEPGRLTVPEFLRQHGYRAACFRQMAPRYGLGTQGRRKGQEDRDGLGGRLWPSHHQAGRCRWDLTIISGSVHPLICLLICSFAAIARKGFRRSRKPGCEKGPAAADFEAVDVLPALVRSATSFLETNAKAARGGKPFFLYIPLAAPHAPILPTPEWQGKSGLNAYADFVMQVDAAVGQILASLESNASGRSYARDLHQRQRLFTGGRVSRAAGQGS